MRAWVGPGEKSRNRSSWARIAATLCSIVAASSRLRSDDRPDGSPIMPVPPPDQRDRPPAVRAGGGSARRSGPGGRCGASRPTGRTRCRRRSAGPWRGAPAARASSRGGSPATRGPSSSAASPGRVDRGGAARSSARHSAADRNRRGSGPTGVNRAIHPPHGIFTADMQTSLSRRQRRRRLTDRRRPREVAQRS